MKILTIIGTRPEAIKMAPLIRLLHQSAGVEHKLCSTGQHREMLQQVMSFFEISADYDLAIMQPGQDLTDITCRILQGMRGVFEKFTPDWVLVHGDTTTAMAAALAAFYAGVRVGHVEAGLRTGNLKAPFPEEANRQLVDQLASAYFAPTQQNVNNLLSERVPPQRIVLTGNTVIDALLWAKERVRSFSPKVPVAIQEAFGQGRRVLLVTGHRRENFGAGFARIIEALRTLASRYPELAIVYPVHLNPQVQQPVQAQLSDIHNVFLTPPLEYPDFIFAMKSCWLILTDSGGVQEEAPSLGKQVLVMRDTTERPEVVEAGKVYLVGADTLRIIQCVEELWGQSSTSLKMQNNCNPYGDGRASEKIVSYLMSS